MMIEVLSLSKKYGNIEAVKDISFSLGANEVLGLLGPNGAGKSTVMRILSGCAFPDSGTVGINGISLEENSLEYKKNIGYLPENAPLYSDMTPEGFLNFAADIRLIPKEKQNEMIKKVISLCGLDNRKMQRIETLSRGYRQRLGLANALLHDPPVLILDEPFTALDPNQITALRGLIKELGKKKTIVFSTHILQEAESLCTRYLVLHKGRVTAQGSMETHPDLEKIFVNSTGSETTGEDE